MTADKPVRDSVPHPAMEDNDDKITTLLDMGFQDLDEVKRALRLAKNDVSEAVAVLTGGDTSSGGGGGSVFGPIQRPMPSSDVTIASASTSAAGTSTDVDMKDVESSNSELGFAVAHFYELETRVFQDNWSIPYKTDESLAKCLESAAKLAREGNLEKDEHCIKFVERVLPEAFNKLLTSSATTKWNNEIQEGIYDMVDLFLHLVVEQLKRKALEWKQMKKEHAEQDAGDDNQSKQEENAAPQVPIGLLKILAVVRTWTYMFINVCC